MNIVITGTHKGIGKSIVMGFAEEHCKIVAIARSEDLLKKVGIEALSLGAADYHCETADIMNCDTQALAHYLMDDYGNFDVVVHNVGTSLVSRNHLGPASDWNHALKMNAVAAIDMNSVLIPPMIEKGSGHVIHISSISAKMLRGNPLYAASKEFLCAYVTSVGRRLAPTGVTLCSVMPGAVAFDGSYWDKFIKEGHPRVNEFLTQHQAVNRFGTPEEIANVVVLLDSFSL